MCTRYKYDNLHAPTPQRHDRSESVDPISFSLLYPTGESLLLREEQPRFSLVKTVDCRGLNLGAMGAVPDLLVTLFESCRLITTLNLWKTYVEVICSLQLHSTNAVAPSRFFGDRAKTGVVSLGNYFPISTTRVNVFGLLLVSTILTMSTFGQWCSRSHLLGRSVL